MSAAPHETDGRPAGPEDTRASTAAWVASENDTPARQNTTVQHEYLASTLTGMLNGAEIAGVPRALGPSPSQSLSASAAPSTRTLPGVAEHGGAAASRRPPAPTPEELLALPIGSLKPNEIQRIVRLSPAELAATYDRDDAISGLPTRDAFIMLLKEHALSKQRQADLRRILRCGIRIHHGTLVMVHACSRDDLEFTVAETETPEIAPGSVVPKAGTETWHIMTWLTRDERIPCKLVRFPGDAPPPPAQGGGVVTAVTSRFSSGPARPPPRYELIADMRQFASDANDVSTSAMDLATALERELETERAAKESVAEKLVAAGAENEKLTATIRKHMAAFERLETAYKDAQKKIEALETHNAVLSGLNDHLRAVETQRGEILRDLLLKNVPVAGVDALPLLCAAPAVPAVPSAAAAAAASVTLRAAAKETMLAVSHAQERVQNGAAADAAAHSPYAALGGLFSAEPNGAAPEARD